MVKQKLEYSCECGRSYILFGHPEKPQKCQRCGRVMQVVSIGGVKVDSSESQPVSVPARAKAIGSLSHLDETWEYQYKANETGPAVREEPATLWIKLKKLWALFFSPRRTRRF